MIERWSEGNAADGMAEEILVELADLVRRHPWWQARAALTLEPAGAAGHPPPGPGPRRRLRLGGHARGPGTARLPGHGLDISRRTLEKLDRPGRRLIEADLARPLGRDAPVCDAALALDVIEHLDDDRAAIRRLGSLVRPGGVLIVSVPALPELFTEFDAIQGHRRRYLPETLRAAFAGSGLELERTLLVGPVAGSGASAASRQTAIATGRDAVGDLSPLPRAAPLAAPLGRPAGLPGRAAAGRPGPALDGHFTLRRGPPQQRRPRVVRAAQPNPIATMSDHHARCAHCPVEQGLPCKGARFGGFAS